MSKIPCVAIFLLLAVIIGAFAAYADEGASSAVSVLSIQADAQDVAQTKDSITEYPWIGEYGMDISRDPYEVRFVNGIQWITDGNSAVRYIGQPVRPGVVVRVPSLQPHVPEANLLPVYLAEGRDYRVDYAANTGPGISTATVTGIGAFTGSVALQFEIVDKDVSWTRLSGRTLYDTMNEVSQAVAPDGLDKPDSVVVARGDDFRDAAASVGFAGSIGAPILLTERGRLSEQARSEIVRIAPTTVYIVGGEMAVSRQIEDEIRSLLSNIAAAGSSSPAVVRLAGADSSSTSAEIAKAYIGSGSSQSIAIIATDSGFYDAVSAAALAYRHKIPIFYAQRGRSLSVSVLEAMKACGIDEVVVVGGTSAVSPAVEEQIAATGAKVKCRIGGRTALDTSRLLAEYAINAYGMESSSTGVATSKSFPDALCGSVLCASRNSVLVLAGSDASTAMEFVAARKPTVWNGFVFGGESVVSAETFSALKAVTNAK